MKTNETVGIVVGDFNPSITAGLAEGALEVLNRAGCADVPVWHVPGSWEIPLAAKRMITQKNVAAVVALGCIIKGETHHFEVLCQTTADALQRLSLETGVPIASGILMVQSPEHARARSGGGTSHRGREAASAALKMLELIRRHG